MLGLVQGTIVESASSGLRYELVRRLGSGTSGEVWLCEEARDRQPRAVKIVPGSDALSIATEVEHSRRAMEAVGQEMVPHFFEASPGKIVERDHPPFLLIVLEFIDGASVGDLVRKKPFPELIAKVVLKSLCKALARLHRQGIIHSDVKGDNLLISREGRVVLCDFGVSVPLQDARDSAGVHVSGSPYFMAPELACKMKRAQMTYSDKIDIWSLGITAIEMTTGSTPWHKDPRTSRVALEHFFHILVTEAEPTVSPDDDHSHEFVQMVSRCLVRSPPARDSAEELLQCSFLQHCMDCSTFEKWCRENV